MDEILTSVANQLNSLELSWQKIERSFSSYVCYYFIEDGKIKLRTFNLHIKKESFQVFIEKSSTNKEKFVIEYNDSIFTIDATQMDINRKFIDDKINEWTGDARREIEELLSPKRIG